MLTTGFVILRVLEVIPPAAGLATIALIVLASTAGRLRADGDLRVQAIGMLGFGALAFAGLVTEPELGRYVVAAGWFLHGLWDFYYLWRNAVVVRSYAEWCGVLDISIAVGLVLTA